MADKVAEKVGNFGHGDYDDATELPSGMLTTVFGLFLGFLNHMSVHFVFLLSYLAFKLLGGDNNVSLNVFLYFFFFALGTVVFLFVTPLLSFFTALGHLLEAVFYLLALLAVKSLETERGRDAYMAAVAFLGLFHGMTRATTTGLVEGTPFTTPRALDFGMLLSGVFPLFLYVVFKFGVAKNEEFTKENLELFFVTLTAVALVVTLVTAAFTLLYTSSGTVKRAVEKKKLEHESHPKFTRSHAGLVFNNLLVGVLVFLALYFMKYCVFPMFFPLDASKKVAVGYKYLFLTLPGVMDGVSRVSFTYLFGGVDWAGVSSFKNLYMLVFDLLLVVYFAVLHNLQDKEFVLFEETFSLLFFLAFMLLHAATSDVVTLQVLGFKEEHDRKDPEAPSGVSHATVPRSHKRVTGALFLTLLESVGSTLGSLLALLLFNLKQDKK